MPAVDMIQPIAVLNDPQNRATHADTALAAALASVAALDAFPQADLWGEWSAGGQGKSVRRGKPKDFRALEGEGVAVVQVGDAVAAAQAPTTYPLSGRMRQLQVSGTDFEVVAPVARHAWPAPAGVPALEIALDTSLGMSTGKASAQAAHAAFGWYLRLPAEERRRWREAGSPARLLLASGSDLRRLAPEAEVEIHDAGHTEIAPGSLTALSRTVIAGRDPR